jgi:uncharacterized protein YdhG (YjbR/CyaY superfamily)
MRTTNHEQQETDFPLKIGNPARRALEGAGYSRLQQLTKITEPELMKLHGMGTKALGLLRNALEAKGLSFSKTGWAGTARTKKAAQPVGKTEQVNEFMEKLDHPFKTEIQVIRDIIKGVDKTITEEIKWKAPSFSYRGQYLVTFNLWEQNRIHLVFHNSMISRVKGKLLEGGYEHRRMAYFADRKDIKAKKPHLEKALKDLIKLQKKQKENP